MLMFDTTLQARFAKSCADAAFGYASATTAAYTAVAANATDFWFRVIKQSMDLAAGNPAQRTGGGELLPTPATFAYPTPQFWTPFDWTSWGTPSRNPPAGPFGFWPMMPLSPAATWFEMFPLRGPAAVWPMAFALIALGVPRNVAWPTAEANTAAMDAAEAAKESIEKAFSSYRSGGGHASAQVWTQGPSLMAAAAALPVELCLFAPWAQAWRSVLSS